MGHRPDLDVTALPGTDERSALSGGMRRPEANPHTVRPPTIDISSELQTRSLKAPRAVPDCAGCERRLLPGETLHVYESGRSLCTLCAAAFSEAPLRRERVHATAMRLAVVPRAA